MIRLRTFGNAVVFIAFLFLFVPETCAQILINEYLPNPSGAKTEESEFVELINTGTESVDISGFILDDAEYAGSDPYVIASGTVVSPGGYVVFTKAVTGLSLNNGGDSVRLVDRTGAVVDIHSYTSTDEDIPYGRSPDSGWTVCQSATPGSSNSCHVPTVTPIPPPTATASPKPTASPRPTATAKPVQASKTVQDVLKAPTPVVIRTPTIASTDKPAEIPGASPFDQQNEENSGNIDTKVLADRTNPVASVASVAGMQSEHASVSAEREQFAILRNRYRRIGVALMIVSLAAGVGAVVSLRRLPLAS